MEMLALMHEATPYGHLLVSGQSPTDIQLAALVGAPSTQIPDLVGELESVGVFSRTGKGVIYSRRMTRDEKRSRQSRSNGELGGNPTLTKQKTIPPPDNPRLNGQDKTQRLEARYQKPDKDSEAYASGAVAPPTPLDLKRQLWETGRAYLGKQGISPKDAGSLLGRWRKTHTDTEVLAALAAAEAECAQDVVAYVEGCLRHGKRINDPKSSPHGSLVAGFGAAVARHKDRAPSV